MTLLTIVQRAADLLSITRPVSVVNSNDQQIRQLFAIANEEGADLASVFDWEALTNQNTFTTTAAAIQVGAVPSDLDHFIANSFFNRTTLRRVFGPITPQRWQAIQVYPIATGAYLAFRQRDGAFLMTPTPAAGETIAYEYVSTNWALSATDVAQDEFQADTDTTLLDERVITLGIRWRWKAAKGLSYGEDMKTYEAAKQQVMARDGGSTSINTGGDAAYNWRANIPDGDFPG